MFFRFRRDPGTAPELHRPRSGALIYARTTLGGLPRDTVWVKIVGFGELCAAAQPGRRSRGGTRRVAARPSVGGDRRRRFGARPECAVAGSSNRSRP